MLNASKHSFPQPVPEMQTFYSPQIVHTAQLPIHYFISLIAYAVVTPLRKAASYEPRIAILQVLGIWGDTWLTRGKYGIYVAVRGSYGTLTGST